MPGKQQKEAGENIAGFINRLLLDSAFAELIFGPNSSLGQWPPKRCNPQVKHPVTAPQSEAWREALARY
jgi:hypothetical protein